MSDVVSAPCWQVRMEAEPDFVPPECEHPDCDSWIAECRWEALQEVCMLEPGHAGPHGAWAKDNFTLVFVDGPPLLGPEPGEHGGQP